MKSNIITEQLKVYQDNYKKHGDTPEGTFHTSQDIQYLRFESLIKDLELTQLDNCSIHDIGSGSCELHKYLLDKNIKHEYSGTDIVPEMIENSLALYPYIKLYNRDIINEKVEDKYDFVVLSGTLNLPGSIPMDEWKQFSFELINSMYEMCTKGIAFNFLTSYSDFYNELMLYLDPKEVLDYCVTNFSRFVNINHGYPLYEVSVSVFRESYIAEKYNKPAFKKYFKNS